MTKTKLKKSRIKSRQPGTKWASKQIMWHRLIFAALIGFTLSGCFTLRPGPENALDVKARKIAQEVRSLNSHIMSAKGNGIIKFKTDTGMEKYTIAWAAAYPDKIRATFLIAGHPVETIISSGKNVTFISHTGDHPPYTTLSRDPDLSEYIRVPIKLSEIILLLLGRPPIKSFNDAYFQEQSPLEIVLQQKFNGKIQHLFLDRDQHLTAVKNFALQNRKAYEIQIISYQKFKNSTIASQIKANDFQGQSLLLTITGFQANPKIKETVFWLTGKGS